uniref:Pentraxin (PTX) domain-containing protein n=1 Tax=Neolamprologus brichardi TaxID=32507 RepID=A0A3Q4HA83_NEOBR
MALLILLVMLTAYLSGKMFIFPQQTNKANVRQNTSMQNLTAVTQHVLYDHFIITIIPAFFQQWLPGIQGSRNNIYRPGLQAELWQSICTTWDSESELVQLWLNGKPSIKKFIGGLVITDPSEQDSHGRGFDINQSFVGMMSDVRMWNYVLSPCEIQRFVEDLNFTPGNVINWRALEFEATGRVLVENKLTCE